MNRKFMQYFYSHPVKCFLLLLLIPCVTVLILSFFPEIIVEAFIISLGILMIAILIFFLYEEKKEKLQRFQEMSEEGLEKKWKKYIDLVNETVDEEKYECNKLNVSWIQRFDQIIYDISTNQHLLRRKLNDFDIASCLIFSLTWDNQEDENILFAFDCAKKVVITPKEYLRNLGYAYKLELEAIKTFQSVNIYIPDETITATALVSILHTYLMQKTDIGILQLSDFLHILYLKCK